VPLLDVGGRQVGLGWLRRVAREGRRGRLTTTTVDREPASLSTLTAFAGATGALARPSLNMIGDGWTDPLAQVFM
jgi:hypothetical protein